MILWRGYAVERLRSVYRPASEEDREDSVVNFDVPAQTLLLPGLWLEPRLGCLAGLEA